MSRNPIPDTLAAALETALALRLGDVRIVRHDRIDWHSATFIGARHEIRLTINAGHAAKLATIHDDDLPMPAGFVADLVVIAQSRAEDDLTVDLDVLTIAD